MLYSSIPGGYTNSSKHHPDATPSLPWYSRHSGFPMAEISSTIGGLEVSGETMTGGLVGEGFNIWPFFLQLEK